MKLSKSSIQFKLAPALLIIFALGSFGVCQRMHAVVPAPDGGYPGGNTAEGQNALFSLTTGGCNTAVGYLSLRSDTTGSFNTAIGAAALFANTGEGNTATGFGALLSNAGAAYNTANGHFALLSNTDGSRNTAVGNSALYSNTNGNFNTAVGRVALFANTTGASNTALGHHAGSNATTGTGNTYIGADVTGVAGENYTIRIGDNLPNVTGQSACYVGGIANQVANFAVPVVIDTTTGKLGTGQSSRRFKRDIKPMDEASEAILAVRPVTFHYKSDTKDTPQFGLIAEEVAKVNPALVVPDKDGKPYTVRYEAVNAMLLNEFLKEHRKNDEQGATIARLEKQLETVTATLQKVSAQVELSRTSPRTVLTDR